MNIKLTPPVKKFYSPDWLSPKKVEDSYEYRGLDGKWVHKDATYKDQFIPTKSYLDYLDNKDFRKLENEIKVLKSKIDYQEKTYGEVDDMDRQLMGHYLIQYKQLRNHLLETCGIYLN